MFKAFVGVSLALVMLLTVVAPALADSAKGDLDFHGEAGSGHVTIRTTHANTLKVTVVISGVSPNTQYTVWVGDYDGNPTGVADVGSFTTNARGKARFSASTSQTWPDGSTQELMVIVFCDSYQTNSPWFEVTF